jgi:hypothetical protein
MRADLLERAVKEDLTETLAPVVYAAYSLEPVSDLKLTEIALDINKKLGYELFEDLAYNRLILDFQRVTKAVQLNALGVV